MGDDGSSFDGKVVLVTGGASGLGEAAVGLLAARERAWSSPTSTRTGADPSSSGSGPVAATRCSARPT